MKARIKVGDMFAGAGGTATGCELALLDLDLEPDLLAVNHNKTALATHELNHPKARHKKANLFRFDPKKHVPGGKLDLLMASPTCSTFSKAAGGKPISWDQRWGRMTPRQVLRWCMELDVTTLLVENVPEFKDWGPLMRTGERDEDGRPLWKPNPKKSGKLFNWWINRLKKRGFVVEWQILNAANFGDVTTRKRFFLIGRRDGQPIVWPEPSHSEHGDGDLFGGGVLPWRAAREVIRWELKGRSIFDREHPLADKTLLRIYRGIVKFGWPAVFQVKLRLYMEALGIEVPELAQASSSSAVPLVVRAGMHKSHALCVRNAEKDPIATISTEGGMSLVEAGVLVLRNHADMRSAGAPLPAITAGGTHLGVVEPFLVPQGSNTPARSAARPVPTVVAIARTGLVEPFVLSQGAGGAPRETVAPVPTIPTRGAHGLVAPYYGASNGSSTEDPLATVTTRDRFALIVPVTHVDESNRARSVDVPLPTVTAAPRGELAFLTAAFGEREGQAARVRSVDGPIPTLCAKGRIPLVHGILQADLDAVDILHRMLEPIELSAAMGFPESYRFVGNKTQVTRQIGNAVPVNTAKALVKAIFSTWRRRAA